MEEPRLKIIALDFDGVVVTNVWPDVGTPLWHNIDAIKEEIDKGTRVILWTCRSGEALEQAVMTCGVVGIKLDAINENLPEILSQFPRDSRKILADEYWDDRAVLKNKYNQNGVYK